MLEERLRELDLELPAAIAPVYSYVSVVIHHDVAYVSGHIRKVGEGPRHQGQVGAEVTLEQAQDDARLCLLLCLSSLRNALGGDLDRVDRALKVTGFVASAPDFHGQAQVIEAASALLVDLLGERGEHARSAIGVSELPRDSPVEIELVMAVRG